MTRVQAWRTALAGEGYRWLSAAASVAVGAAFFSLRFWLLPRWLGFSVEMAGAARWRWLAAVPSVLAFAVALRCVWDFGWTGRGTPRPARSAAAPGGGGFLPLPAHSHIRRLRRRLDWAVGNFWASSSKTDRGRRSGCARRPSVCSLLRRADVAREIRSPVRRVSPQCSSLVAGVARQRTAAMSAGGGLKPMLIGAGFSGAA
jgi:hypothetical protein